MSNANPKHIELLEQAKAHYAADMLRKQTYGLMDITGFKGCSVGCHLHHIYPNRSVDFILNIDHKHRTVADYYEYPEWLAHLQDTVFEGLPADQNKEWHVQLAEAIASHSGPIDWDKAYHRTQIAILTVVKPFAGESISVVDTVLGLHERAASGQAVSAGEWMAALAADAAADAAAYAANAADAAYATDAADAAAYAAADAARAARAAADAAYATYAAADAARAKAYQTIRDGVLAAIRESGAA